MLASISRVSHAYANGVLDYLQIEVNVLDLDAVNALIDTATFQSICTFYNLRKINFQSERDVQLDDTTLLQMAKAWLLLEELVIYGPLESTWGDFSHHIAANAFVSLLQHYPHLTSTGVLVN